MTKTPAVGDRVRITEARLTSYYREFPEHVGVEGVLNSAEPSTVRRGGTLFQVRKDDGALASASAVELVTPPAEDSLILVDQARVQAAQVAKEILGADPLASEVVELAAFILGEELLGDAPELVGQPFVMAPQDEQPAPVGLVVSDNGAVVNWLGENYYRGEQPARPAVDTSRSLEIHREGASLSLSESIRPDKGVAFVIGAGDFWLTADDVDAVIAYLQALKG